MFHTAVFPYLVQLLFLGRDHLSAFLLFICSVTDRSLAFNTQANFLACVFSPTHPSPLRFYSLGLLGLHTDGWTQGCFSRHQTTSSFSVSKTQSTLSALLLPSKLLLYPTPSEIEGGGTSAPSLANVMEPCRLEKAFCSMMHASKLKPSAWRIRCPRDARRFALALDTVYGDLWLIHQDACRGNLLRTWTCEEQSYRLCSAHGWHDATCRQIM